MKTECLVWGAPNQSQRKYAFVKGKRAKKLVKRRSESSMSMEDRVFTVTELAKYLRMKPITIYKHLSGGKLPGFKVGSHWRFKKKTIDSWIEQQENINLKEKVV